jgi:secreted trypsin-like serine protease
LFRLAIFDDLQWRFRRNSAGDSGQALVVYRKGKKRIVGIVSNGYESCETMGEPEIFTRVDGCIEFIEETIKGN